MSDDQEIEPVSLKELAEVLREDSAREGMRRYEEIVEERKVAEIELDAVTIRAVIERLREIDRCEVVMYDDSDPYQPSVEYLVKRALEADDE